MYFVVRWKFHAPPYQNSPLIHCPCTRVMCDAIRNLHIRATRFTVIGNTNTVENCKYHHAGRYIGGCHSAVSPSIQTCWPELSRHRTGSEAASIKSCTEYLPSFITNHVLRHSPNTSLSTAHNRAFYKILFPSPTEKTSRAASS